MHLWFISNISNHFRVVWSISWILVRFLEFCYIFHIFYCFGAFRTISWVYFSFRHFGLFFAFVNFTHFDSFECIKFTYFLFFFQLFLYISHNLNIFIFLVHFTLWLFPWESIHFSYFDPLTFCAIVSILCILVHFVCFYHIHTFWYISYIIVACSHYAYFDSFSIICLNFMYMFFFSISSLYFSYNNDFHVLMSFFLQLANFEHFHALW